MQSEVDGRVYKWRMREEGVVRGGKIGTHGGTYRETRIPDYAADFSRLLSMMTSWRAIERHDECNV